MSKKEKKKEQEKERREHPRVERKMLVHFHSGDVVGRGMILNFSEVGLLIQTADILTVGSIVQIPLEMQEKNPISLEGRVVWMNKEPLPNSPGFVGSMGIILTATPPEYQRSVQKIRLRFQKGPRAQRERRFEAHHAVRFEHDGRTQTGFTDNLSRGGMFLITSDKQLKIDDEIRIKIEIPGFANIIEILGRVAHELNSDQAKETDRPLGFGIQFLQGDVGLNPNLIHYLNRLQIHRATPNRRLGHKIRTGDTLQRVIIPEILFAFLDQKKTGILSLTNGEVTKRVFLTKGHPVYVESPLQSETLGQYMVHQGIVSEENIREALKELEHSDKYLGEILVGNNLITQHGMEEILVDHQEAKITNTYPWFDGQYQFLEDERGKGNITFFPLRVYHIIFDGIRRWFDASLIRAWMGLSEETVLKRYKTPPPEANLPADVQSIFQYLKSPQTVRELAESTKLSIDDTLPIVYGAILCDFVELSFTDEESRASKTSTSETEGAPATPEEIVDVTSRINKDYSSYRGMDFFSLLSVTEGSEQEDIRKAFDLRRKRYPNRVVKSLSEFDTLRKLGQISSWLRLAYDTLSDPDLRTIYTKRHIQRGTGALRRTRLEAERFLLEGVRALLEGNTDNGVAQLERAKKKYPHDSSISGYLGWARFQEDRKRNLTISCKMLDEALIRDPSDPHLRYFRGEIHAYLGEWEKAEWCFSQALRLFPQFLKAATAYEIAKERRQTKNQLT